MVWVIAVIVTPWETSSTNSTSLTSHFPSSQPPIASNSIPTTSVPSDSETQSVSTEENHAMVRGAKETEVVNLWTSFRNDESALKGKAVTKWPIVVSFMRVTDENVQGYIYGNSNDNVIIQGKNNDSYRVASEGFQPAGLIAYLPKVHEGDCLMVDGTFATVSEDGEVVIAAKHIVNKHLGDPFNY